MTTVKQSLTVDGQPLSNNDPDLVIKLDPHPGVQISNIADDAITYSFAGDVTQDTEIKLNLTFTYKGTNELVVPLTLTQAIDALTIQWVTVDSELVGAASNSLYFKVTDGSGNPVTGLTKKSLDISSVPNTPEVSPGYSNSLIETDVKGTYYLSVNLGHIKGKIKVNLTVNDKTLPYVIPTKEYMAPGTPLLTRVDKDKLFTTDGPQTVVLTLQQDKYAGMDPLATGKITALSVTGGATTGSVAPINLVNGTASINIVPNGNLEDIIVTGTITESDGRYPRDFNTSIKVEQDVLKLVIVSGNPLSPVTESNRPVFKVQTSKGEDLTGVTPSGYIKLTSDPLRGVVIGNKTGFYQSGNPTEYYFDVNIGHMPGNLFFNSDLLYKGLVYKVAEPLSFSTPGTPVVAIVSPIDIDANNDTQIEVYFQQNRTISATPTTVDGILTGQFPGSDMSIVTPFTPKAGSPGVFVGTIRGAQPQPNGVVKFTLQEDYEAFKYDWTDLTGTFNVRTPVSKDITVEKSKEFIYNEDGDQSLVLTLSTGGTPITGSITLAITGTAELLTSVPVEAVNGTVELMVRPTSVGECVITGTATNTNGNVIGDFTTNFNVLPTPHYEVGNPGESSVRVGGQVSLMFTPLMNGNGAAQYSNIDITTSTIPANVNVVNHFANDTGDYEVVIEGLTPGTSDLQFNFYPTNGSPTGLEGRDRAYGNAKVTVTGDLTLTSVSSQVYIKSGEIGKIDLVISDGGNNLPINSEGVAITSPDIDQVAILDRLVDGFNIKSMWVPDQGMNTKVTNFTLTYYDRSVDFTVKVSHQTNNPAPIIELTGDIVGVMGDTGKVPIKVTSQMSPGLDLTDKVYEFMGGNDYLQIAQDGTWTVIKDPETTVTDTIRIYFRIPEQDMKWGESATPKYIIGNKAGPHLTDIVKLYQMDLWETTPISFAVKAGDVDIASSITDVICVTAESGGLTEFEFVKISDTSWGFKSIKSDPIKYKTQNVDMIVKVTYEDKQYELPMQLTVSTKPNDGRIPTERFNVDVI